MAVAIRNGNRRSFKIILVFALLFSMIPFSPLAVTPVHAEVSADPDSEIVYIDSSGFIRVLDYLQTGNNPKVDWASPTGGWSDFALGDVNNDGDVEIIAIKSENNVGTLTVFDPVAAEGSVDKTPNGIPWATLYTRTGIPGELKLVATGRLDPNLPGAHIIYIYQEDSVNQRAVVLKPAIPQPDGRQWAEHYTRRFNEHWDQISVGNVDGVDADEIALVDKDQGRISVFRSDSQSGAILKDTSSSKPWRATTIAQFDGGSKKEVIGIRKVDPPLASFFVFKYKDGDNFDESNTEAFSPEPSFAFPADIQNDGKDEIVMLRSVSGSSVRMIVRADNQSSVPSELEQPLDSDNGYRVGDGGDVDGDGKEEIVIMRDNNIRIYTQPERNATFSNFGEQTNSRSIHIGDLDKIGFVNGPQFGLSQSTVEDTLEISATGSQRNLELRNVTDNTPISFKLEVENGVSWFDINPKFSNTPKLLTYQFNAIGLAPGDYATRVKITSDTQNVVNQPIYIEVKLTVTAANIDPRPTSVSFSYPASQAPDSLSQNVSVFGTDGVKLSASVAPVPAVSAALAALRGEVRTGARQANGDLLLRDDLGNETIISGEAIAANAITWLSVSPDQSTIPVILTLTATPANQSKDYDEAYVVIIGDERTGQPPQNVRLIRVKILRANHQLLLPMVRR
ncbi:MAG: hypothetical protein R3C14_42070 [Caldilineaceae bacterium]